MGSVRSFRAGAQDAIAKGWHDADRNSILRRAVALQPRMLVPGTGNRPGCRPDRPRRMRGRREGRVLVAPAARLQKSKQAAATTGSTGSSGLPCAMVLRLIARSPRRPGFLAPVISSVRHASAQRREARNHAALPSAFTALVWRRDRVQRMPASRSVTIDQNALCIEAECRETITCFRKTESQYFS
jgi:hypothetical protein